MDFRTNKILFVNHRKALIYQERKSKFKLTTKKIAFLTFFQILYSAGNTKSSTKYRLISADPLLDGSNSIKNHSLFLPVRKIL